NRTQALGIVDVVADIGHLFERDAERVDAVANGGELVVDALQALDPQLRRAHSHHGVGLHRHDQIVDADVVEAPQPEAVATPECERLLPALVHPDPVVGEDTVEVEEHQTDSLEQRLELCHERAVACAPECSGTGSTSSNVTKSSAPTGRRRRRPTSLSSSYGGKPPSARALIPRTPPA